MDNYKVINEVGAGSFGTVWKAIDARTTRIVAIKKLKKKCYSWEECLNLGEVKSLLTMNHPNIVKLLEIIREDNVVYLVFEYMESNLSEFMKRRKVPLSEAQIRNWCMQVFLGLVHMHDTCGYFHRDLKPSNLLIDEETIKIADLGSAREVTSKPTPTNYGTTRWYRAPELMLPSGAYGCKVDMWAMGAIIAELFSFRPLFRGANKFDQMRKICSVIGSPTMESWAHGLDLARDLHYQFPKLPGVNLSELLPSASKEAISLISSLCSWDPSKRPTAIEALHHPFFHKRFINIYPGSKVNVTHPTASAAHGVSKIIDRLKKKGVGFTIC